MNHRKLFNSIISSAVVLAIGAGVAVAHAQPEVPQVATPTITTLPLFGAQLTAEVATGPDGTLASVAVNPADGSTAAAVKPNKVEFLDEDGTAKVVVNGHDGEQRASALTVAGAKVWAGSLCDDTAATVNYTVNDDGTITDVTASSNADRIRAEGHSAEVTFSNSERVRIHTRTSDGGIGVRVDARIRCEDAPDPSLNAPLQPTTSIEIDDDQADDDQADDDQADDDQADDDQAEDDQADDSADDDQADDSDDEGHHDEGQHDGSHG